MIILRQKEFKKGDTDGLNVLGKIRYKSGISKLAEEMKGEKEKFAAIKPSSTVSPDKSSVFNSHKLSTLIAKSGAKREELKKKINDNPWNNKGALREYFKQLVSSN